MVEGQGCSAPSTVSTPPCPPVPKDDVIKLLDGFGAKGDTSKRVMAEMWARGWLVVQGPIPKMRIT